MSKELNIEKISNNGKTTIEYKIKKAVAYYKTKGFSGFQFIYKINKFISTCNHKEYIYCVDIKAKYVTVAYRDFNKETVKTTTVLI